MEPTREALKFVATYKLTSSESADILKYAKAIAGTRWSASIDLEDVQKAVKHMQPGQQPIQDTELNAKTQTTRVRIPVGESAPVDLPITPTRLPK